MSAKSSKSFISKSRFKLATECVNKPYFSVRKDYGNKKDANDFLRALAKGGFQVGELARWYVPGGKNIQTLDYQEALDLTDAELQKENAVIYEAAIKFQDLFIRVDILVKNGKQLKVYEVKAKSFTGDPEDFYKAEKNRTEHDFLDSKWKPYFFDIAFQDYVVRKAYPQHDVSSYLYLIDKRKAATVEGLNQKFFIKDVKGQITVTAAPGLTPDDLGEPILTATNLTTDLKKIQSDPKFWRIEGRDFSFEAGLSLLSTRHAKGERSRPSATRKCRDCEFRLMSEKERALGKSGFDECWSEILPTHEPPNGPLSIDLWNLNYRTADKFLEPDSGLYLMSQISEEDLAAPKKGSKRELYSDGWEDFERRRIQLRKTNLGETTRECLEPELRSVIEGWKFPLHFIDFETTRVAIPFHRCMRPYEQLAFQFSHHVMYEDGTFSHANEWINTTSGKFPNFDFVRALRQAVGNNGTIFRYATHENTVLCEILRQLEVSEEPDRADLINWIKTITYKKTDENGTTYLWRGDRAMVDLLEVVKRYYYHPLMGRSNSIKAVLPAILNDSAFLREKYSRPIYGVPGQVSSKNFTTFAWDHIWVVVDNDKKVRDPYAILKSLSEDIGGYDYDSLERVLEDDEVADGGAAMTAYAMMQFTQMSEPERKKLTSALLRYCELDTLAMIMLYEHWCEIVGLAQRIKAKP